MKTGHEIAWERAKVMDINSKQTESEFGSMVYQTQESRNEQGCWDTVYGL